MHEAPEEPSAASSQTLQKLQEIKESLEERNISNVVDYFSAYSQFLEAPCVGSIIRQGGKLMGYGQNPDLYNEFPAIESIMAAYTLIGKDLALTGQISKSVQAQASQSLMPLPFYKKLLNLI